MLEGFTGRRLPDRSARLINTIAHWGYGSAAGVAYGIVAGSLPAPRRDTACPSGAAGLYKPIWEYDASTLAWDLGTHLAYGAGTETAFWLLTKIA